jgi:4-amino-4-deoxy-L-arabinose transferase-like glycosyltransferase
LQSPRGLLAIALGLATLQLIPFLDRLPGLHGDEAWAGLRAHATLEGQISVYGLTAYTGPIHQLLLVPVLETFGFQVWALRSLTVIASLLSVWLFFGVVRLVFDAQMAGIAALVLASMPWFALYGRGATEHFALNPVLALAATRCLLAAADTRGWKRDALASVGGILLALGTWNHLIFAPVPLVLGLVAFTLWPRRMIPPRMVAAAAVGFLIAALPRLLALLTEREANQLGLRGYASVALSGLMTRLMESPSLFAATTHGDILYRRYTGEVLWPTPWVAPALLAVAAILIACRPRRETEPLFKNARHVASYLALFSVLTLAIVPESADRHFLLIHYFVVPFIAIPFRLAISERMAPALGAAALSVFLVFNVGRTAANFHAAHLSSGGKLATFQLGGKMETSNHFVRTDLLYEHLQALGVQDVYAEFFIALPLAFYDVESRHFRRIGTIETMPRQFDTAEHASAAIVWYRDGSGVPEPRAHDVREISTFQQFEIADFQSPLSSGP